MVTIKTAHEITFEDRNPKDDNNKWALVEEQKKEFDKFVKNNNNEFKEFEDYNGKWIWLVDLRKLKKVLFGD